MSERSHSVSHQWNASEGSDGLHLPNRLLTTQEAADFLSVPVRWVQAAVQERRLRCTRIGKHVRFTGEHLMELIEANEQPVTWQPPHRHEAAQAPVAPGLAPLPRAAQRGRGNSRSRL